MKFLNKKNSLIFFLVITAFAIIAWNSHFFRLCSGEYYSVCINLFAVVLYGSIVLVLLLVPIIFTLPFRTQVFEAWRNFALWTIPFVVAVVLFFMLQGGSGGFGIGGAIGAGFIGLFLLTLYGLYLLISLIIIILAVLKARKKA